MPEDENFRREFESRADRSPKQRQQGDEQRSHGVRERHQSPARNRNGHNAYRILSRDRATVRTLLMHLGDSESSLRRSWEHHSSSSRAMSAMLESYSAWMCANVHLRVSAHV
jgi:hypothetical protein